MSARARITTCALALLGALLGGCRTTPDPDATVSLSALLRTVISDVLAQGEAAEAPKKVFVTARGEGMTIDLESQAAVIDHFAPAVTVDFVDDITQALDDDGGVRPDSVVIAVGAPVRSKDVVELTADVLRGKVAGVQRDYRFVRRGAEWVAEEVSEQSIPPVESTVG